MRSIKIFVTSIHRLDIITRRVMQSVLHCTISLSINSQQLMCPKIVSAVLRAVQGILVSMSTFQKRRFIEGPLLGWSRFHRFIRELKKKQGVDKIHHYLSSGVIVPFPPAKRQSRSYNEQILN